MKAPWRRIAGIAIGVGTHAVFAVLVWRLVIFLAGEHLQAPRGEGWINVVLAAQFGISHSILLHPRCRQKLTRWIPGPFYGCFFTICTSASLFLMFWLWRSQPGMIWQLSGLPRAVMWSMFRAAFTMAEFRALATAAGLSGATFKRHWPQRFLMEWEPR